MPGQIGWKSIEMMPGRIGQIGWLNWVVKLDGNPLRLCLVELGGQIGQIGWKSIEIMPGPIG